MLIHRIPPPVQSTDTHVSVALVINVDIVYPIDRFDVTQMSKSCFCKWMSSSEPLNNMGTLRCLAHQSCV